ncbi:MAG: hypothetical protein R6V62_00730 [Candidatus Fermentibacteraceae bacterium]
MKHGVLISAVVFLVSTTASAFPAGSGGGSTSDSEDENIEGWLALGAAVLVAGFLIWDVVRDSGEVQAVAPEASEAVDSTGIDWAHLQATPQESAVLIGVSVFPGENGWGLAQYFQKLLLPLEDEGFTFGGDPVNLGDIPMTEQAAMAYDFLGFSWFVAAGDSSLNLFTRDQTLAWSAAVTSWDSVSVRAAAVELLTETPSLR